jgi:hypothetical protein
MQSRKLYQLEHQPTFVHRLQPCTLRPTASQLLLRRRTVNVLPSPGSLSTKTPPW